jgi:hypothetical protein
MAAQTFELELKPSRTTDSIVHVEDSEDPDSDHPSLFHFNNGNSRAKKQG